MPHVRANGIQVYYEEEGSGPPLLLMTPTGWPGSVWQLEQSETLSREHRVIVYDYRGVGKTDKSDVDYSTQLFAEDALALLKALEAEPAHVLGFSVGGRAAQIMALTSPATVRSLILAGADAGGAQPRLGFVPGRLALHMFDPGYGRHEFWMEHLSEPLTFNDAFRAAHADKISRLADTIVAGQPPAKLYFRHVIARTGHFMRESVGDIRTPTLIMVGSDDKEESGGGGNHVDMARELAGKIPGAELAIVPNARHLFPWEQPEATNEMLLSFLRRH